MSKKCTDSEMHSHYRKMRIDGKQISVHRFIMEQKIGRRLFPGEIVHHINGDRYDNRPENLELITPKEHAAIHLKNQSLSQTTREKISKSLIGNQRRKGIPHTDEIKEKIGQSMKRARKNKFWSTRPK